MAITMTRAEYEAKYGVKPVFPPTQTSSIDTTPAPIRMTRAEYEQMFFPKQKSGLRKTLDTVQGEVASAQMEGVNKIKRGVDMIQNPKNAKETVRGGLRIASGAIDTAFAPLAPIFGRAMGLLEKRIDRATDDPNLQRFAMSGAGEKTITTLEDIVDLSNVAGLYAGGKSAPKIASNVGKFAQDTTSSISTGLKNRATNKLANEILNIENSYNKTAIKNTLSKDAGNASRQRIANTDVLSNIVDEDGKITFESAKNAAKAYEQQTIAGAEGVVRDILKNENKTMNVEEARSILRQEIASSGLEGADLITALNGLKKEIAGLAMRGDEFGNVPLHVYHDAKISTTRNIDFTKPPEVSYRRSLAKAYKNIVEQKSTATVEVFGKKYRIPEINQKLSEYYGDIERIESLGGKRVKGGKLGKYSAQIAGNLAGAAAGGAFGGPVGVAIGTVVGGEVASRLKGKQMANTFGKPRGRVAPKSDLLEAAKLKAQEGQVIDLRIPDKKVGASTKVPKTKEISRVEAQIAKNVADQKKAIKAGDFTLVKALKEVYRALVEKLKDLIKLAKETSEKGFINFGEITDSVSGRSSKPGKSPKTETKLQAPSKNSTTKAKDTQAYAGEKDLTTKILKDLEGKTTVSKQYILDATNRGDLKQVERDLIRRILDESGDTSPLAQEARKYKSAEEFVKAQTKPHYINIEDIKSSFDADTFSTLKDTPRNQNINLLNEYKSTVKRVEKSPIGREITKPISVQFNVDGGNGYRILDGNHRYLQALKNGDKRILVKFDTLKGTSREGKNIFQNKTKSQLTDIWNKAKGSDTINVSDFAKKVKAELLPLKRIDASGTSQFATENVVLPDEIRGNVKNYMDVNYTSPIKTSAGEKHFNKGGNNYFGHTRIEDMADNKTRRVIEVQSDLYQKGNLEKEVPQYLNASDYLPADKLKEYNRIEKRLTDLTFAENSADYKVEIKELQKARETLEASAKDFEQKVINSRKSEVSKLQQYNDPTAHFRMIREEIKKASQDGKTKLQFPTGETAMKIEGLGTQGDGGMMFAYEGVPIEPQQLKVGREIYSEASDQDWVITETLGNGKFRAIPKELADQTNPEALASTGRAQGEMFDISGEIDTNNPIYKFYEKDVQKYLNKFGGKRVVDDKGVEWIEVPIKKEWAKMPVEAFAILFGVGLASQQ